MIDSALIIQYSCTLQASQSANNYRVMACVVPLSQSQPVAPPRRVDSPTLRLDLKLLERALKAPLTCPELGYPGSRNGARNIPA